MSTRALRPPAWTERAVCLEVDSEVFFPGKGEPTGPAKALCRSCEVRLPCLAWGLEFGGEYGIFGGFSAEGRERVRRQLRDGLTLADVIAGDDAAFYSRIERAA